MRADDPFIIARVQDYDGRIQFLTRTQLRAALSLLFRHEDVTALTRDLPDMLESGDINAVVRRAVARFSLRRLYGRLWRREGDQSSSLGPSSGAPAEAAIALVLHIGMGLGGEQLGDALDRTSAEIGRLLDLGRRTADATVPSPCHDRVGLVGRYRDTHLEAGERIELLTHLRSCDRCRGAIERYREVDARLEVEAPSLAEQSSTSEMARTGWAGRAARAGGLVLIGALLLVLFGAAAVLAARVTGDRGDPVPLLAAANDAELRGWLLIHSSEGPVQAINLATGEARILTDTRPERFSTHTLSPDQRLIASWYQSSGVTVPNELVVTDLDGRIVQSFEWAATETVRGPVGWLDNDTLLVNEYPLWDPTRTEDENVSRARGMSTVIAIDVTTTEERVVAHGEAWTSTLSPDGTMLAIWLTQIGTEQQLDTALQLRPVRDGILGDPVVEIEQTIVPDGGFVWSAGGRELFARHVLDELPRDPGRAGNGLRGFDESDIVAIDRDGRMRRVMDVDDTDPFHLESVSPITGELIYSVSEGRHGNQQPLYALRAVSPDGRQIREMISDRRDTGWRPGAIVWSPDGRMMLTAASIENALGRPVNAAFLDLESMGAWIVFDPDGERQIVRASFDPPTGIALLAWLPESALPGRRGTTLIETPAFGDAEPVTGLEQGTTIDASSAASPSGEHIMLVEREPPTLSIWRSGLERNRRLTRGAHDTSWLPDSSGVIGVADKRGDQTTPSRLMLFASGFTREYQTFDYQQFDPAGIGERLDAWYAAPGVAPNGDYTSFFVVDDSRESVALWIASADGAPRRVVDWTLPDDALLDIPLVATWISPDALIFTEPVAWDRGLPGAVAVNRVTIAGEGIAVDALTTLRGRGDDRGVILTELALSPNGREIAYRLRHFRAIATDRQRTDTLHVAATCDISQQTQLARSAPGYGLAWLDDGRWLVAGLEGRIALLSVQSLDVKYVTDDSADARYPIVLNEDEIWYSADDGSGTRVMRVVAR